MFHLIVYALLESNNFTYETSLFFHFLPSSILHSYPHYFKSLKTETNLCSAQIDKKMFTVRIGVLMRLYLNNPQES